MWSCSEGTPALVMWTVPPFLHIQESSPNLHLSPAALAFGSDQDYQIDIINELDLANATYGITQVAGLHNSSKAFLFRDVGRAVHAPAHITEKVVQLFKRKSEFTFLASIQQKSSTSGVIFSIHESEHSYFELESSGVREEIRYHYRFKGKPRSESFPYRLADGQWHKIALTISATHLLLHVDCNRIYERVIDPPQMEITPAVECGSASTATSTACSSDFLSLVQGIMDLQELLAKMTLKLNYAETRLTQLEGCHCERTCSANGLVYRDMELWVEPENCRNCACKNGVVECRRIFCPPANCSEDSLPLLSAFVPTARCTYMGQTFSEGQRFLSRSCRECKNGLMVKVTETCPELNCTVSEQILPDGRCCNVCRGYDFCSEGLICGENSECKNRNTKAECECKSGFASIHGDSTYCEGRTAETELGLIAAHLPFVWRIRPFLSSSVLQLLSAVRGTRGAALNYGEEVDCDTDTGHIDECATQMHYCQSNTVCVNLPGSHRCDCLPGFIRHDDCASGQDQCDENAICINTIRGHLCTCKPGYVGNGTICRAFCEEGCRSGGTCVSPNTCVCPSGFTGRRCETDIDECSLQTHTCWNDSVCVNLPGGYDCVCTSGPGCGGDCTEEEGIRRNGEDWKPSFDRCAICSCKDGQTYCRRRPCDCGDPEEDLFCCPGCDNRPSSQCLDQSGRTLYRSGASWQYGCQQCRCMEGEVDCWPLVCPMLMCEYTAVAEGECCPRCVTDPCLADNLSYDIRQTCQDPTGTVRLSGDTWHMTNSPCTNCECK
ncbi:hypothetical protein F7725_026651, partial [Dissostichus mawsoni]